MESDSKLEDLRSTLSCVFEKLGAESLTEPDRVELVARAEVVQEQIDAIEDGIDGMPTAPSDDQLF